MNRSDTSKNVDSSELLNRHSNSRIALFGAEPTFAEPIVVGRPNIPNRQAFLSRIEQMFDGNRFTNFGPLSEEFERRVAESMNVKHCIAMCNGTISMELATTALGLQGEVIVPSFTFVATVHALWRQNLRPVFCDVDPVTHTLDPKCVEAAITPETSAILAVSLWGNYEGERALRRIADAHGLPLLYDSAHSFGCAREDGGREQLCDLESLSFHATKCIQAMEGGAIVTNDDVLAEKLRLMVNFGFSGEDNVVHLGTNAKMNEAAAAMGLTSLEGRHEVFERNRSNHAAYAEGLANVPGIELMKRPGSAPHNYQYVVAEVNEDIAGLTRNDLVAALRLENVLARRYFHPGAHRMAPYRKMFPDAGASLPVTEALSDRVMVLPNGLAVAPAEVHRICETIGKIVDLAPLVRGTLTTYRDPKLPEWSLNDEG